MKFQIERRTNLSYEEFANEYLFPLKPVIVSDALRGWQALRRWTPEFFKREFGGMTFLINEDPNQAADYKGNDRGTEYTMADFVDRILASTDERPAPYFRNRIFNELFPSLKADIHPLPEYLQPNWLSDHYAVKRVGEVLNRGAAIEIFIGGKGGSFPVLHYDGAGVHAFLMQIYGRKEYVVFSPDQEPFLYPSPGQQNLSLIKDVERPDLKKFPLFANSVPTKFILEPGELLFVPSHWWHTVKMLTPSITLSANVLNQSNWHELIRFVSTRRRNAVLSLASRMYLTGAGSWRSWRDREWRKRAQVQSV